MSRADPGEERTIRWKWDHGEIELGMDEDGQGRSVVLLPALELDLDPGGRCIRCSGGFPLGSMSRPWIGSALGIGRDPTMTGLLKSYRPS